MLKPPASESEGLTPSFFGYIGSQLDANIVFQAARANKVCASVCGLKALSCLVSLAGLLRLCLALPFWRGRGKVSMYRPFKVLLLNCMPTFSRPHSHPYLQLSPTAYVFDHVCVCVYSAVWCTGGSAASATPSTPVPGLCSTRNRAKSNGGPTASRGQTAHTMLGLVGP